MIAYKVVSRVVAEDGQTEYWSAIIKPRDGGRRYHIGRNVRTKKTPMLVFKTVRDAEMFIDKPLSISEFRIFKCEVDDGAKSPAKLLWYGAVNKKNTFLFWEWLKSLDYRLLTSAISNTTTPPHGTLLTYNVRLISMVNYKGEEIPCS